MFSMTMCTLQKKGRYKRHWRVRMLEKLLDRYYKSVSIISIVCGLVLTWHAKSRFLYKSQYCIKGIWLIVQDTFFLILLHSGRRRGGNSQHRK